MKGAAMSWGEKTPGSVEAYARRGALSTAALPADAEPHLIERTKSQGGCLAHRVCRHMGMPVLTSLRRVHEW
eukprot:2269569-Pleurochrysis_carterae.AAC.3